MSRNRRFQLSIRVLLLLLVPVAVFFGCVARELSLLSRQSRAKEQLFSNDCKTLSCAPDDLLGFMIDDGTWIQLNTNPDRTVANAFVALTPKTNRKPTLSWLLSFRWSQDDRIEQLVWIGKDCDLNSTEILEILDDLPWLKFVVVESRSDVNETEAGEWVRNSTCYRSVEELAELKNCLPNITVLESMWTNSGTPINAE